MAAGNTTSVKFELTGLKELQAALKKVAPETRSQFAKDLKRVGQIVADDTRDAMPKRSGRARRSVKVKVVTRRGAEGIQIVEGGDRAAYVPWLDFGGTVGGGRKTTARVTVSRHASGHVRVHKQVLGGMGTGSVVREFVKGGRYLYPSYERNFDAMVQATVDAVAAAAEAAGLEVTSSG